MYTNRPTEEEKILLTDSDFIIEQIETGNYKERHKLDYIRRIFREDISTNLLYTEVLDLFDEVCKIHQKLNVQKDNNFTPTERRILREKSKEFQTACNYADFAKKYRESNFDLDFLVELLVKGRIYNSNIDSIDVVYALTIFYNMKQSDWENYYDAYRDKEYYMGQVRKEAHLKKTVDGKEVGVYNGDEYAYLLLLEYRAFEDDPELYEWLKDIKKNVDKQEQRMRNEVILLMSPYLKPNSKEKEDVKQDSRDSGTPIETQKLKIKEETAKQEPATEDNEFEKHCKAIHKLLGDYVTYYSTEKIKTIINHKLNDTPLSTIPGTQHIALRYKDKSDRVMIQKDAHKLAECFALSKEAANKFIRMETKDRNRKSINFPAKLNDCIVSGGYYEYDETLVSRP